MVVNSKFVIPNAREVFKSLRNAKVEWKIKTPMQKWCYFYSIGKISFGLLGMALLNDVNYIHWRGYSEIVYAPFTALLSLYSICYYAYQGELQMGLPSTCMAFILIGVCRKKKLI